MAELVALKKQRKTIKASLSRMWNRCTTTEMQVEDMQSRKERAEELLKEYEKLQNEIDNLINDENEQIVEEEYRTEIEEIVLNIKSIYYKLLARSNTSTHHTTTQESSEITTAVQALINHQSSMSVLMERFANNMPNVNTSTPNEETRSAQPALQLPRVQLPDFDGNQLEWVRFKELFEAFIHSRNNLANVEKLEYLHTKLKGDALLVIKHLKPMNSNYEVAWQLLNKKYNNTEKIKGAYMDLLFSLLPMKTSSLFETKRLYNSINEGYNALKAMDETVDHWSSILLYNIEKKLDNNTATLWFKDKVQGEKTTFTQLLNFLEKRITELECIQATHSFSSTSKQQQQRYQQRTYTTTVPVCPTCTKQHLLYQCDEFKKLNVNQRRNIVQKNNICFNCLHTGHKSSECKASLCKKCDKRHNTLLHITFPLHVTNNESSTTAVIHNADSIIQNGQPTSITTNNRNEHEAAFVTSHTSQQSQSNFVMLPTAMIAILDSNNSRQSCRALLDSGSQGTLITESCVQRLGLKRQYDKTIIYGLGAAGSCTRGKVTLNISTLNQSNIQITTKALCLSKLTQLLPSVPIDEEKFNYFKGLNPADPNFYKPKQIDVILGADVFIQCCLSQKIIHPTGSPTALNTIFGWVFMGQVYSNHDSRMYSHHVSVDLDQQLQRFWEMEDIPSNQQKLSPDEEQAEQYFVKTTQRDTSGRYVVRLPFKNETIDIGQSKINALNRLFAMENKFNANPQIEHTYKQFMHEYIQLGHMELISKIPANKRICYLPHHAVIKPTSTTSKLRVVFDASCKTSNGKSLNDNLLTGPKIQNDLFDMLVNFRKFKIAFVGDIEKMYRQILMHKEDRFMQCILWRNNQSEQIKTYSLNTVTYGTAAAPFLAIRTLHQIADDNIKSQRLIANIIKTNFYVDDFMYCTETVQEATNIRKELCSLLSQAGLHIRKWTSNSTDFLKDIPITDRAEYYDITQQQSSIVFTLGLLWDTKGDYFKFNIDLVSSSQGVSKRSVLSDIAKLYDPMGWIAPVIISMKIFMQKLWLSGTGWDEKLSEDLLNQWLKIRNNIHNINDIKISRWFHYLNETNMELHGFSDASEQAYAAVVYIKIKRNEDIFTHLVAAKTRVTPIKQISLPRLELCAAHLLVKLITKIHKIFHNVDMPIHGWTDSTVVLAWLSNHPCKWKSFIANRTSAILSVIPSQCWHYIESKHNPADVATRGTTPIKLIENKLWWHGPDELLLKQIQIKIPNLPSNCNLEERKRITVNTVVQHTPSIIDRFSCLTKLIRITAYIKRFIYNCKNNQNRIGSFLKTTELQDAQLSLIRISQNQSFYAEIKTISSGRQLSNKNRLSTLIPFIDQAGILRVGGRIDNANINYDQKHPIILHNQHQLTKLIVRYYHIQHYHAGKRLLFYHIHLKYWIPSASKIIKNCIYKCTTCIRQRGKTYQQQMGNLPKPRVVPAPTFSNVGIDFAGPVQVISWKGRGNKTYKAWISIFICLATKAIHIELVSELSTTAFIAALRRFIARRGSPNNIYTDNGTNFVGANRYLTELYEFFENKRTQEGVIKYLSPQQIQWHFSPPAGPHFGGIWEAGVKSIKYHLNRILKDARPTFEEMQTLLTQIESCLNSRPLCNKFEGDIDPLTPAHFIILRPMTSIPDEVYYTTNKNNVARWQYIQQLVHQFWKKWSLEYLHQMQQRAKWKEKLKNIAENDIVIVKDDNLAPSKWIIGKIIELHRGKDGLARVATVKTCSGNLKRPIIKLCPLLTNI